MMTLLVLKARTRCSSINGILGNIFNVDFILIDSESEIKVSSQSGAEGHKSGATGLEKESNVLSLQLGHSL